MAICAWRRPIICGRSGASCCGTRGTAQAASLPDDGTAAPTIGPDGDVYYGVLEANFPSNHARGWMLHFSPTLTDHQDPRGVRLGRFGVDCAQRVWFLRIGADRRT